MISKIDNSNALQYSLLLGITIFAAAVRIYKIREWGFWIDEIYTIQRATSDLGSLFIPLSTRLISFTLELAGSDEFGARLMPGVIGLLSIPVFFFPIRKVTGATTALLAVLLLALSPWHLFWSQNARFYTALMLFYGLASLCIFIWLESGNFWYFLLSFVLLAFAILERGVALFIFPVVAVYVVAVLILPVEKPPGLHWRNLLLFLVPILGIALIVVFATGNIYSFFTQIVGHQHNPIRVFLGVVYDVGLPLFLLAISGGVFAAINKSRLGLFLLIGALVPLVILLIIAPFTQAFSRYVFHTLIIWIILGAMAIKMIIDNTPGKGKYLALGVALLLLADSFSQDVLYFGFQNGNRENFRGAFEVISKEREADDLVVSGWPEIGTYYLQDEVLNAHEVSIDEIQNGPHRVWFVVDNRSGFPSNLQAWIEANSRFIAVRDVYLPGKLLMMRVFVYTPGHK